MSYIILLKKQWFTFQVCSFLAQNIFHFEQSQKNSRNELILTHTHRSLGKTCFISNLTASTKLKSDKGKRLTSKLHVAITYVVEARKSDQKSLFACNNMSINLGLVSHFFLPTTTKSVTSVTEFWGQESNGRFLLKSQFKTICTVVCIIVRRLACLWSKMPMFQWEGMREGVKPLPLAFQYLILMI